MADRKEVDILLVEDDPADVVLTKEGLRSAKLRINLFAVSDGIEALRYLRREGPYKNEPRPDLVLLDLNMPKKDGRETLKEIKEDVKLRGIPVVVLTTSEAETDIVKCYDLGANCYISKPLGFEQFTTIVRSIEDFWFTIVKLPSQN